MEFLIRLDFVFVWMKLHTNLFLIRNRLSCSREVFLAEVWKMELMILCSLISLHRVTCHVLHYWVDWIRLLHRTSRLSSASNSSTQMFSNLWMMIIKTAPIHSTSGWITMRTVTTKKATVSKTIWAYLVPPFRSSSLRTSVWVLVECSPICRYFFHFFSSCTILTFLYYR